MRVKVRGVTVVWVTYYVASYPKEVSIGVLLNGVCILLDYLVTIVYREALNIVVNDV